MPVATKFVAPKTAVPVMGMSGPKPARVHSKQLSNQTMLRLQRACGCGGSCPDCSLRRKLNIQPKLAIGPANDHYEREADSVADRVMRMTGPAEVENVQRQSAGNTAQLRLQRAAEDAGNDEDAEDGSTGEEPDDMLRAKAAGTTPDTAPLIVHNVLESSGHPLDPAARAFMEPRFGHDFSQIRVHTDSFAAASAKAVNAKAYTVGSHVVFDDGNYAPQSDSGRALLAHELTHTIQQGGGGPMISRSSAQVSRQNGQGGASGTGGQGGQGGMDAGVPQTEEIRDAGESLAGGVPEQPTQQPQQQNPQAPPQVTPPVQSESISPRCSAWDDCTRLRSLGPSLRAAGYNGTTTGTYISDIVVDIHVGQSTVSLTWANTALSPGLSQPPSLNCCPGAGNCTTDCSNNCNSQVNGSHCTSLSPPGYQVQGYDCTLPGDAAAKFVTWFNRDRGIAFHYYDVFDHPESHGCVRMDRAERGAEWIHDNVIAGVTNVTVNRNPAEGAGPKCYGPGGLRNRPASAPTGPVGRCAPAPPRPPARRRRSL